MAERLARDYGYDRIDAARPERPAGADPLSRLCRRRHRPRRGPCPSAQLALGLARLAEAAGATLHESSEVLRIAHGTATTPSRITTAGGEVTADHVILAANGYLDGLEPQIAARVMPINNYIVATEPLGARAAEVLTQNIAAA